MAGESPAVFTEEHAPAPPSPVFDEQESAADVESPEESGSAFPVDEEAGERQLAEVPEAAGSETEPVVAQQGSASANVREQGGHYMHRVSRRMRRNRMRGGHGEGRMETGGAPVAGERSEVVPEAQRNVSRS